MILTLSLLLQGTARKMPPKRPSLVSEGEIIKQGTLMKSPPPSYIGKRWRRRVFVLRKCLGDAHTLSYYSQDRMNEEQKGNINISEICEVEKGSDCPREELASTLRSCRCRPGQVLVIRTTKRTYFLVTEETEDEIDSWYKSLSCILKRSENTCNAGYVRPDSYPCNHPNSGTVMEKETLRQRSKTDPSERSPPPSPPPQRSTFYTPPLFPQQAELSVGTPCPTETPKHSPADVTGDHMCFCSRAQRLSSGKESIPPPDYDSDVGSDEGSIYDVPRKVLQRLSGHSDSSDPQEISDIDPDSDDVYEPMFSIVTRTTMTEENPQEETPPPAQKVVQPMKNEVRELRQMDLLKIIYERVGTNELQNKEVTVPTEHLRKYLDVEELGECLYIRKWNGPTEIGCLFQHGDYIDIVNEFRVKNRDVFLQMLNNSVQSSVKLIIVGDSHSPVFHADNCNCGAV
ncbi:hypothetical protein XENTR_v10017549 [Xenopus tropicalis]|uniref:PH domain-containing protein n=3 Tax=Xenopus tropicalis TaxID=8364 RepID=A0A6I8Q909_XENTR|nr:hypothetical protein XENTR_v10017549 [Xenopus tropicalis]